MTTLPFLGRTRAPTAVGGRRAPGVLSFVVLVLATLALQSFVVISANVILNPRSEFPVDVFVPLVEDERHTKTLRYARFEAKPDAVIFGSSRAWGLPPDALEEQGHAFAYNFAYGGATTLDAWNTWEHVLREGPAPRTLVYVLSDWDLDTTHDIRWTGTGRPTLEDAPHYAKLALGSLRVDYVRDTWRGILVNVDEPPTRRWSAEENGTVRWLRPDASQWEGPWSVAEASERDMPGALAHYAEGVAPDPAREALVGRLVEDARGRGTEVVLVLPPMHPQAIPLLGERYGASVAHARDLALATCAPGVRVFDLSEPASYGGDLGAFVDGWHFGFGEGRRILEHVHEASADLCDSQTV